MFKHHVVLGSLLLLAHIYFCQVVNKGECQADEKDSLIVSEESISVLQLVNEERHSEDPKHLSLESTTARRIVINRNEPRVISSKSEKNIEPVSDIKHSGGPNKLEIITNKNTDGKVSLSVKKDLNNVQVTDSSKHNVNQSPSKTELNINSREIDKHGEEKHIITKIINKQNIETVKTGPYNNQNDKKQNISEQGSSSIKISSNIEFKKPQQHNTVNKFDDEHHVQSIYKVKNGENEDNIETKSSSTKSNQNIKGQKIHFHHEIKSVSSSTTFEQKESKNIVKSNEKLNQNNSHKVNNEKIKSEIDISIKESKKIDLESVNLITANNGSLSELKKEQESFVKRVKKDLDSVVENKHSPSVENKNGRNKDANAAEVQKLMSNIKQEEKGAPTPVQTHVSHLNDGTKKVNPSDSKHHIVDDSIKLKSIEEKIILEKIELPHHMNKKHGSDISKEQKNNMTLTISSNKPMNVTKTIHEANSMNIDGARNVKVETSNIVSAREHSNNNNNNQILKPSSVINQTPKISTSSGKSSTVTKIQNINTINSNLSSKPSVSTTVTASSVSTDQRIQPSEEDSAPQKNINILKNIEVKPSNSQLPVSTSTSDASSSINTRSKRSVSDTTSMGPNTAAKKEVQTNTVMTPSSNLQNEIILTTSDSSDNTKKNLEHTSAELKNAKNITIKKSNNTEKANSIGKKNVASNLQTESSISKELTLPKTDIPEKIVNIKENIPNDSKTLTKGKERDNNTSNNSKSNILEENENVQSPLTLELKSKSVSDNSEDVELTTEVCEIKKSTITSSVPSSNEEIENSKLKENKYKITDKQTKILTKSESVNESENDKKSLHTLSPTAESLKMENPSESYTQHNNSMKKKIYESDKPKEEKYAKKIDNTKQGDTFKIINNSKQTELVSKSNSPDTTLDKSISAPNKLHNSDAPQDQTELQIKLISETNNNDNVTLNSHSDSPGLLGNSGDVSNIGFIPKPESQIQKSDDIQETDTVTLETYSDKESTTENSQNGGTENPKSEALQQDLEAINFISAWKLKRGRSNQPDESHTQTPSLDFPAVPEGESFRIHELGLSEGLFVFSYLGSFLSWMQPYDFPVELLRDALWNRLSIVSLITESLPVEMGFIACLCIGVFLALAAPFFLMIHACCSLVRRNASSNNWEDETASSSDNQGNCRRRTLVFLLQTILLLLVAGIVAMFVTNEQLSSAVHQTPNVVHTALSDITTFLRNSNLQLHFVVTKSLDQAVETASNDLDNIENLLGRPIQRELEEETGVDVALDALVDATAAAQKLSNKVHALHEYCGETRGLALVAQERLADLRHQVDMLRRQCPAKDRALCETVEGGGLDVVLQLDSILNDQHLTGLRRLSHSNLSQVTQQAKGEFQFIPMHVEKETREARNGVRRQLLRQKSQLDDSVWSLEAIARDLSVRVDLARDRALNMVQGATDMEQWRYLTGIGAAVAVLLIWTLLIAAVSCGCCGAEDKAGPTLLVTVGVLCPLYLALWALALVALLVGGHGEVFVCRPLYDEPGYGALTKLMDKPGILFQRGGGFFSSLLYGNDSLNVPLKDVLMACQKNQPSYPSFKLHQVFDVDGASDHQSWESLHRQLARLEVNLTDLQLLTPDLQEQLQELLNAATANLTTHRVQLSGPVTGKDLLSFSDQLESVANQITDLATASRMETLATRTRRLIASHVAPLTQRKEDMVYQLTALEVQLLPLQRQVNQSLSHLKTIQFFINNQGANISHTKSQEYINRIVSYLQQYRDHVLHATSNYVAPCRPIWDLFHAMRVLFCRHVMDPLNGFWFATVWCLLLMLTAIPVCVQLAACYRQTRPGSLLPRSHSESPREAGSIPDPPEPSRPWASSGGGEPDVW